MSFVLFRDTQQYTRATFLRGLIVCGGLTQIYTYTERRCACFDVAFGIEEKQVGCIFVDISDAFESKEDDGRRDETIEANGAFNAECVEHKE